MTRKIRIRERWRMIAASMLLSMGCSFIVGNLGCARAPNITHSGRQEAIDHKRLALLVTIGDYAGRSGWDDLSSGNDRTLMRQVLLEQGFEAKHILEVQDPNVDKTRILDAFQTHLLQQAGPGDVVVFHYSGHGHRITDDNHDEIDGYDEVLVPYDAPKSPPSDYQGNKHIRDDELNRLFTRLRRQVGPGGDLVVFLDTCNSGSGTRGEGGGSNLVRGALEPIGSRQHTEGRALALDRGSGFVDETPHTRGGTSDVVGELAPHAVFSAAPSDALASETVDEATGRIFGSLTLALASALNRVTRSATYRSLFADVKQHMAARVRNAPQLEGEPDRELFGGRFVEQKPYFEVSEVNESGRKVKLRGGSAVGVLRGSVVELHARGTRDPSASSVLAKGGVTSARPLSAIVKLDKPVPVEVLKGAWAFVTEPSFGDLKIRVQVKAEDPAWGAQLTNELSNSPFVEVVTERPDVRVKQGQDKVLVERAQDALPLLESSRRKNQSLVKDIKARLVDFARNRYLRKLDLRSPGFDVAFDLIPCRLECETEEFSEQSKDCECVEDLPPSTIVSEGGLTRFSVGEGFRIRLINKGAKPAYVTILDLMPDGQIGLLWPLSGTSFLDTKLKKEQTFDVSGQYQIEPPVGTDVLKLFASQEPIDFAPITSAWRTQDQIKEGSRGALDKLFEDVLEFRRGIRPTVPRGSVSTVSIPIEIVAESQ